MLVLGLGADTASLGDRGGFPSVGSLRLSHIWYDFRVVGHVRRNLARRGMEYKKPAIPRDHSHLPLFVVRMT